MQVRHSCSDFKCPACSPRTAEAFKEGLRVNEAQAESFYLKLEAARTEIDALKAEVERLTFERDLAIAHDRQPYPTAEAYELACKAFRAERERAELLRKAIDVSSAVLLKGTPLKNGPVFVQGSEAEKLLNAVDSARASLLEALLAAKLDEGKER